MSEHSPEPWHTGSAFLSDRKYFLAKTADHRTIAVSSFGMQSSSGFERENMDRIVACVNFLAAIPTADLDTIMQNETRWGYVKRDIIQAAAFERRMQGCREGERLSEFTFETQPTSRPSP